MSEAQAWPLQASEGLAILIVMDDTEATQDVWGMSSGSGTIYHEVDQPFRIRFLSTYLSDSGDPLWMDGGVEVDGDAEWDGAFAYEFGQVMHPAIRDREVLTPRPRDALRQALASEEVARFVADDHLVIWVVSAFDDHSDDTEQQRLVLRDLVEGQPWSTSLVMATPQTDGCRGVYGTARSGHNLTREALSAAVVADLDLCEYLWMDPAIDTTAVASGRQNFLQSQLTWPPIEGTVEVFGMLGASSTLLERGQWMVDGSQITVGPPLRGFDEVRATYDREVE